MAKRQNTFTIETDDVQGEGSFIKVRALTVTEHNAMESVRMELFKVQQAGDVEGAKRLEKQMWAMTSEAVLDWDWVDGDDKPLPKPHQNPAVFDELTMQEIFLIAESLNPFAQRQKKEETKLQPSS